MKRESQAFATLNSISHYSLLFKTDHVIVIGDLNEIDLSTQMIQRTAGVSNALKILQTNNFINGRHQSLRNIERKRHTDLDLIDHILLSPMLHDRIKWKTLRDGIEPRIHKYVVLSLDLYGEASSRTFATRNTEMKESVAERKRKAHDHNVLMGIVYPWTKMYNVLS